MHVGQTNLKANILFKGLATLFAGVDRIRVGVPFVADEGTGVLATLATL